MQCKKTIGIAIAASLLGGAAASADMTGIASMQRYYAEQASTSATVTCEEQYRSFMARQMRPSDRLRQREACRERVAQQAAAKHIAATDSSAARVAERANPQR
jgi:hypothetical protein